MKVCAHAELTWPLFSRWRAIRRKLFFLSVPDELETTTPSELRVVVRPDVLQVHLGQTVELTCIVDGGDDNTNIYWIQDTPERVIHFQSREDSTKHLSVFCLSAMH
jgi:hypothetical protein